MAMDFVNYTPSRPERNTLRAHPDHFHATCSTSTILPTKLSQPHHSLPFPCLPSSNVHFPTAYSTSASHQTYVVPPQTHPLPNRPFSSVPSCSPFKDSRDGQRRALAVPLNDFDKAFMANGIAGGFKNKTVDLTADITSHDHVDVQASCQPPVDVECDPKSRFVDICLPFCFSFCASLGQACSRLAFLIQVAFQIFSRGMRIEARTRTRLRQFWSRPRILSHANPHCHRSQIPVTAIRTLCRFWRINPACRSWTWSKTKQRIEKGHAGAKVGLSRTTSSRARLAHMCCRCDRGRSRDLCQR